MTQEYIKSEYMFVVNTGENNYVLDKTCLQSAFYIVCHGSLLFVIFINSLSRH